MEHMAATFHMWEHASKALFIITKFEKQYISQNIKIPEGKCIIHKNIRLIYITLEFIISMIIHSF